MAEIDDRKEQERLVKSMEAIRSRIGYLSKHESNVKNLKKIFELLSFERDRVMKSVEDAVRNGDVIFQEVEQWLVSANNIIEKLRSFIEDEDDVIAKKRRFVGLKARYLLTKEAKKGIQLLDLLRKQGGFYRDSPHLHPVDLLSRHGDVESGFTRDPPLDGMGSTSEHFDSGKPTNSNQSGTSLSLLSFRPPSHGTTFTTQAFDSGEPSYSNLSRLEDVESESDSLSNSTPPHEMGCTSYVESESESRLRDIRSIYAVEGPSRMSKLMEIMEALKDDEVRMIGVYGMGGVGKTTLVKEVARRAGEDDLFDEVVMGVVRQSPDLERIQGEIARKLGLEFQEETISGRVDRLCERLKKEKRILVILDDIWARINFGDVGIPFGDDHKGCKVLLTSRSHIVLSQDMGAQQIFSVDPLPEEEAWYLFKKMVGDDVMYPDLEAIAMDVLKGCAGLPVLIVTTAKALKNRSLIDWKGALRQLTNVTQMDEVVHSALELSYNCLETEELRSTFLLCSLMHYDTHVLDLLNYGMGLGLFQGFLTMEEARVRVCTLVHNLKVSFLLLDSYSSEWFAMHDVIRDVALAIASRDQFMFVVRNEIWPYKDNLKYCTAKYISLYCSDVSEFPEHLECPQLEFFCTVSEDPSLQVPDQIFREISQLRVLGLTNMNLSSLPSSLIFLENLRTLCLYRCLLRDVSMISELKKLEILCFVESDIDQIPREIGQLRRLKLLDLTNCSKLKLIAPRVLSSLLQLEELRMGNSFLQWDVEELNDQRSNASLTDLKHLSCLTTLDIHIPDAKIFPKDLFFKKLERFRIIIGDAWDWSDEYETSRRLKLKLDRSMHLEDGVKMLLMKTEDLYLDELKGACNVLHELDREGFSQLKHLHVRNGPDFEYIVNSMKWSPCNAFPVLESLILHNLINLEKICCGQLTAMSFGNLRIIRMASCDRLKNLFTFSVARGLLRLQEIEVTDCKMLEEIVAEGKEDDADNIKGINKIVFTQLRSLKLHYLPQLINFCSDVKTPLTTQKRQKQLVTGVQSKEIISEDEPGIPIPLFNKKIAFPNLEDLKLSLINIEKIWPDKLPAMPYGMQTLTSLVVEGCGGLKYLFSSSMVKNLVQLRNLEICNCKFMERIIVTERLGEEERMNEMLLPKLDFLKLKDLPKLTRFYMGNLIVCCSLSELWIENCSKLKTFISKPISVDMAVSNEHEEIILEEKLHTDIQPLFDEKVAFPSLEYLLIAHMDNLNFIWNNQLAADSFSKLNFLGVGYCESLLNVFPCNMLRRLQRLETLNVFNCGSLEEVFELQGKNFGETHAVTATKLRELNLACLPNLKHAWNKDLKGILTFQNLRSVRAFECERLKNLFPASIARGLLQLEELEINSCGVEEIVAEEEGEAVARFVFPQVTSLKLWKLPELKSFYPGRHISEWPVLKKLLVYGCDKVEIFASGLPSFQEKHKDDQLEILLQQKSIKKEILIQQKSKKKEILVQQPLFWVDQFVLPNLEYAQRMFKIHRQAAFIPIQNLTSLILEGCGSLKYLFSSSMIKFLVQLKNIEICDCKLMEGIIIPERLKAEERMGKQLFHRLDYLKLKDLPKLTTFCTGNLVQCPSLRILWIENCPALKAFISNSTSADMSVRKEPEKMKLEENLQDDMLPLFDEKVGLPGLEVLAIFHMDNLRMIWHSQLAAHSFCKLDTLLIGHSEKLLNIFPSIMLGRLQRLERLKVTDCGSLEEIFDLRGLNVRKTHVITATQLRELTLVELPNLKHIWNMDTQEILDFLKSLHSIQVTDCPSLIASTT